MDTRDTLETLLEYAEKLRDVGVARLELDGLKVELRPASQTAQISDASSNEEPEQPPTEDAWTYGESADAQIPGFSRLRERGGE